MMLSAHRVLQPATGAQAIHAFHYIHGGYTWEGEASPNLRPGMLQASRVVLEPLGSNRVLSYLDMIAPDDVPTSRLLQAFAQVYDSDQPPPFRKAIGNCTFESDMARAFRLAWRKELVTLFEAAIGVRITIL